MKNINTHFDKKYFESRKHIAWRGDVVAEAILNFCPGINRLVDVGCGTGDILAGIQKAKPSVLLQGIDGAIEAGKQYMPKHPTFLMRDMRKAKGVLFGCFEVCCCFEVFQYIEQANQNSFLRNLTRLSNSILISAPDELKSAIQVYMISNKYREKDISAFRASLEHLKDKQAIKGIYYNSMYFERT